MKFLDLGPEFPNFLDATRIEDKESDKKFLSTGVS